MTTANVDGNLRNDILNNKKNIFLAQIFVLPEDRIVFLIAKALARTRPCHAVIAVIQSDSSINSLWGEVFYLNGKILDDYFLRKVKSKLEYLMIECLIMYNI